MLSQFTQDAVEVVEAPIEGQIVSLAVPQVPLAHQVVGVAHLGQDVRHGHVLGLQPPGVAGDEGDPEADIGGVAAGQQGGPGGGTGRVHVVVLKSGMENITIRVLLNIRGNLPDGFFRKFVNILGDKRCVRICEANICVSLVICESTQ